MALQPQPSPQIQNHTTQTDIALYAPLPKPTSPSTPHFLFHASHREPQTANRIAMQANGGTQSAKSCGANLFPEREAQA